MTKIQSPQSDYTGTTTFGDGTVLDFKDGKAETDEELSPAVYGYLQGAGFGIGAEKVDEERFEAEKVPDPREVSNVHGGTRLRDAAVDPDPEVDFLGPINAGAEGDDGNPHGPNVVNPQIHASSGQVVLPGPVGTYVEEDITDEDGNVTGKAGRVEPDLDVQEAREVELAERVLIGNEQVGEATVEMGERDNDPEADKPKESKRGRRAQKA